jgi:hypothetical protein
MVTNTLCGACGNPTLHKIHRGAIRAHHAKAGYDYPTIHLPFTFSGLVGLSTRIYQTVHDGALAFLVVVSSESNPDKHEIAGSSADLVFTRRRSPVRIRPSPLFFYQSATLEPSIEAFLLARIMTKNKHNKDKNCTTLTSPI